MQICNSYVTRGSYRHPGVCRGSRIFLGRGSRLRKEGLRVVDEAQIPAYLKSSKEANVLQWNQ